MLFNAICLVIRIIIVNFACNQQQTIMEYIKLGATDLRLSVIAYGSFAIGGTMWGGTDEADSIAAVRASIDNGITSIDTAPFYGFGLSEEMIGRATIARVCNC